VCSPASLQEHTVLTAIFQVNPDKPVATSLGFSCVDRQVGCHNYVLQPAPQSHPLISAIMAVGFWSSFYRQDALNVAQPTALKH